MKQVATQFPGGGGYQANLQVGICEKGGAIEEVLSDLSVRTTTFQHPVVFIRFELAHQQVPGLVCPLSGSYELVGYWESLGAGAGGEISKTAVGKYNALREKIVIKDSLALPLTEIGSYKATVGVKFKHGPIQEIVGFTDLDVFQLIDSD